MGINKGMMSSKSDEWETPQDLFDELDEEFGFQLDPCATEENAKCPLYWIKEQDGLKRSWTVWSPVFMNPPYGRQIGKWVKKAYEESQEGTVVCLLPARTDTRWFHDYIWDRERHCPQEGVEVRFLKGRLKFGGAKNSAPFPSMIVVFDRKSLT